MTVFAVCRTFLMLDGTVHCLDTADMPRAQRCPSCRYYYDGVRACRCQFTWLPHPVYRGYCRTCRRSLHFMYDHSFCARAQMREAGEKIGAWLAKQRDQAILDIILGRGVPGFTEAA